MLKPIARLTRSRRGLVRVCLIAVCATSVTPMQARADTLADIQARHVLHVAVPQDSPPFGSVGPDMSLRGYDIDMATQLARQLKVGVKLVPVSSANRLPYLESKKVDLIIYSLGKSAEREKVIDFSAPYALVFSGIFGAKGVAVTSFADLANKTIAVSMGSLEDQEVTRAAPPSTIIKRFADANSTISALLSGQVQLCAVTNTVVAATNALHPQFVPELKVKIKVSPAYIGVSKDDGRLLDTVNHFIADEKASGRLNVLYQKWFGQPLPDFAGM